MSGNWVKNTSGQEKVRELGTKYLRSEKRQGTNIIRNIKVKEKSENWVKNTSSQKGGELEGKYLKSGNT